MNHILKLRVLRSVKKDVASPVVIGRLEKEVFAFAMVAETFVESLVVSIWPGLQSKDSAQLMAAAAVARWMAVAKAQSLRRHFAPSIVDSSLAARATSSY